MNYYKQLSEYTIIDLTTVTSYSKGNNYVFVNNVNTTASICYDGDEAVSLWAELEMLCQSTIFNSGQ